MTWQLFATTEYQLKHTKTKFEELVSNELTLMKGERLFSNVVYAIPNDWRGKDGFENYLKECPRLLKSPHWILAKRNKTLGLSKENVAPALHPKYADDVKCDVRSLVEKYSDFKTASDKLNNQGTPCPSGGIWTPLNLEEYCKKQSIKRDAPIR